MTIKNKILIWLGVSIIVIVIIVTTVIWVNGRTFRLVYETISQELEAEEIDFTKIKKKGDTIIIIYNQPIDFEMEDILSTWAYIMASAVKNIPDTINKIVVKCNFENGEKVEAEAEVEDIISFVKEEISTESFLEKINITPLTEGPKI